MEQLPEVLQAAVGSQGSLLPTGYMQLQHQANQMQIESKTDLPSQIRDDKTAAKDKHAEPIRTMNK